MHYFFEFKLCYLKNLKLFSITIKESFEPIVLRKRFRSIFLRNRSLNNARSLYGKKTHNMEGKSVFKVCGMGPWLVLVSPCFRENVVATCKIGSFLCSLDNLLQKNVFVLFFGNQISKIEKEKKNGYF